MEKKNEQHSRQKFIEEQLNALKQEEKALNDARLTLLNQKWQVQSENDKLKKKIAEENQAVAPMEVEVASKEPTPEPSTSSK